MCIPSLEEEEVRGTSEDARRGLVDGADHRSAALGHFLDRRHHSIGSVRI